MMSTDFNQFTDEQKDKWVNGGKSKATGVHLLTDEESAWKSRNWPKVGDKISSPQVLVGNNIPCGYDSEGNPSNDCYCHDHIKE